jgi:hypothetical protein
MHSFSFGLPTGKAAQRLYLNALLFSLYRKERPATEAAHAFVSRGAQKSEGMFPSETDFFTTLQRPNRSAQARSKGRSEATDFIAVVFPLFFFCHF